MEPKKEHISENSFLIHTRVKNDNEILGKMPSWIIRYGMLLTGAILTLLFMVFILYKVPYTITIRGRFCENLEVSQSYVPNNLGLNTVQKPTLGKELISDNCFIGEYSQESIKLIKEMQLAKVKYENRAGLVDTKNIILEKIILDTINKKTIILLNGIRVNEINANKPVELEIKTSQKNIFQLLF